MTKNNFNRAAPRPLSVYLGAAMTMLPPDADNDQRIQHRKAVERMLHGIRKYQDHAWRNNKESPPVAWRNETSTLLCCASDAEKKTGALLLVPSMINGSEIFDLMPDRSFIRWMAGQRRDVYLLDWGCPVDDPGLRDMDGVISRILDAARFIGGPVDALGYCMGGTLLLAAASREPDLFGNLILLSAPWDFHAGDPRMRAQIMTGAPSALQLLEQNRGLPVDWIQNVFARVNPRLAMDKFAGFLDMTPGSADEKVFIAVEDWLNSGQDLPSDVARECIMDWYGRNRPAKGEWADLGRLAGHDVLVVAADKDILVPPESASAVASLIPGATLLTPPCGHISLMAGRRAPEMVWKPVARWMKR
jgi:polyhydroxyalkanoate synthase